MAVFGHKYFFSFFYGGDYHGFVSAGGAVYKKESTVSSKGLRRQLLGFLYGSFRLVKVIA